MSSSLRSPALVRAAATVVLCAWPLFASAQGTPAAVSPLQPAPWGSSADTVRARASDLGWTFVEVDADGDYAFRATIDGQRALVFATFGTKGLTRLLLSVDPHPTVALTYGHLADTLSHRLGPSVLSTEGGAGDLRPARSMLAATAWQGVLMGLRRDGRIIVVLTCPESSPRLPGRQGQPVT